MTMNNQRDANNNVQQHTVAIEVGRRIRQARKGLGWTQKILAQNVGVSRVTINQIEKGRRKQLKPRIIQRIAESVGVPPEHFLGILNGEDVTSPHLPHQLDDMPSELLDTISQLQSFPWEDQEKLGHIIGKLVNWYAEQIVT